MSTLSSDESDVDATLRELGARLRALRHSRGLTLDALAEDSGRSASYLSQIENGAAVPSLIALQMIAAELETELSHFFQDEHRGTRVTRGAQAQLVRLHPAGGREYVVLAGQVHERAFSALLSRHLPGSTGDEPALRHLGEEFVLVLKGRLRARIGDTSFELGRGDWLHYSSHSVHAQEVISDEAVEALWLLAPAVI